MGNGETAREPTNGTQAGTYTLVIELVERRRTPVGALGKLTFDPGWYAYTGSAHGPGGLARVERHEGVAVGDRDVRHWHIDYLLGLDGASIDSVTTSQGIDAECAVAAALADTAVSGFGASDCSCDTHLAFEPRRDTLVNAVRAAHRGAREDG